jgi:Protein of unknown function (DUF3352)
MTRVLNLLAVAALAVAVAGCGGSTKTGSVSDESGATLVSSAALAYAATDSDLSSDQWQQVDDLLQKFPIHDKLISELKKAVADEGLDYEDDIAPALGPEVDWVAVGSSPNDLAWAALTKPDSIDKAKALIKKLDASEGGDRDPSATRVVGDWLVASDDEASIDRVLKGSGTALADDDQFKAAQAKVPGDALVKAYVNGRLAAEAFKSLLGGAAQTTASGGSSPFGLDKLDWLSASLVAKDNGVVVEANVKGATPTGAGSAPYASKLISGVPADALAFATFRGSGDGNPIDQLRSNPALAPAVAQAEHMLGMRLEPILALLGHETAVYVRRGPGLPEFSFVLESPDTSRALATLDRLAQRVATLTGAKLGDESNGVRSLNLGQVTLRWTGFDGRVLLTTGPTGIDDYRASGDKLADDSGFKDALDAAGVPDKTNGFVYVDLRQSLELIQNYVGLSGEKVPAELRENLKPLQSFVAYATSSDGTGTASAFLELK